MKLSYQQNHHQHIHHHAKMKQRAKKTVKKTEMLPAINENSNEDAKKPQIEAQEPPFVDMEVESDKDNKQFEVRWNDEDNQFSMSCADGRDIHTSLLKILSMAYPDSSTAIPPLAGFECSCRSVIPLVGGRKSFLAADNLHFKDFVLEEPPESQTLPMQEALRTPGVRSQRLSVEMTPKTLRQPKPGEMLLSVHGSPLGVYKENNMEAIHESEEV